MRASTPISGIRRCRGFTLLETLLVCVLLALAVGGAAAYLSDSDQKQFTVNLSQISAQLRNARRQAIITGAEQHVRLATIAPDEAEVDDVMQVPEPANWFNPDMQLHFAETLDNELEESAEVELVFFPMGSSTGGVIQLTDGERDAFLYVDPLTSKLMVESRLDDLAEIIQEQGA